jgi:hypothetical protein
VWAVTLNEQGLVGGDAEAARTRLAAELGVPVFLPLRDDLAELVEIVKHRIETQEAP